MSNGNISEKMAISIFSMPVTTKMNTLFHGGVMMKEAALLFGGTAVDATGL